MTDPKQVPIAMQSPVTQTVGVDPWTSWGQTLKRPGPIIGMPNGVGVGDPGNYQGESYFSFSDPMQPIVTTHFVYFLSSIGLNYKGPGAPTMADAASGTMDQPWGDAAGKTRGAEGYGDPWTFPPLTEVRPSCIIRPGWEMTGDWYSWGMNAPGQLAYPDWCTAFKTAYRRCVNLWREIMPTMPSVGSCFNPNGDYLTKGVNLDDFYPGDDIVDSIGVDIYDYPQWQGGMQADGVTPILSPQDRWDQFILPNLQAADAYAAAHGKQVCVPEAGAGEGGGDNPTFVTALAAWCASAQAPVNFIGWWGSGGYNSNLEDYPQQKAAFIAAFGG
jgi:hypothetical protein